MTEKFDFPIREGFDAPPPPPPPPPPHGPHGPHPHGPHPEPPGPPHGPHPHGPHGPHGPHHAPPPPPPPHGPHGPHVDREHYETLDVNGKLFTMIDELGHASRFRFDGRVGQNRALSLLQEGECMTQRELTERLGVRPASASEIVGKLERAGLVTRTPSEADRRTADIRLTEAGLARRKERADQEKAGMAELFAALSEEEKTALLALLEKLSAAWRDEDPPAPPEPPEGPEPPEPPEEAELPKP